MIFDINTTHDISKLSQISLVVFIPNITTNHAITYTYCERKQIINIIAFFDQKHGLTALEKCDF